MRFLMLTLAVTASWVSCSASMSLSQESGAKVEVLNEVKDAQPDELLAIAFIKSHHPELAMLLEVL